MVRNPPCSLGLMSGLICLIWRTRTLHARLALPDEILEAAWILVAARVCRGHKHHAGELVLESRRAASDELPLHARECAVRTRVEGRASRGASAPQTAPNRIGGSLVRKQNVFSPSIASRPAVSCPTPVAWSVLTSRHIRTDSTFDLMCHHPKSTSDLDILLNTDLTEVYSDLRRRFHGSDLPRRGYLHSNAAHLINNQAAGYYTYLV